MLRPGVRFGWDKFARPLFQQKAWEKFFRPNLRRTLLNSSRDNHWPRSPILPEGKGFNWDAFRWTNYRVCGIFPPNYTTKMSFHDTDFVHMFRGGDKRWTTQRGLEESSQ